MARTCLNCGHPVTEDFCGNCGQKAQLERITGNYIKREISDVLFLEKGFFYTIKELVIHPGKRVREFLSESRNRLVKPIIFIILTSLIYSLIVSFFRIEETYIRMEGLETESTLITLSTWVQENYGYANLIMGVFIAFWLKLFFRKSHYNFFEILILLCYVMGVFMLFYAFLPCWKA